MTRAPSSPPAPPVPMQQPVAPPPQAMQRSKPTLLEAIAAASSGFGDLVKDSDNDYLKSRYLALPGLLKAIKGPLLEHGVVIYSQVMMLGSFWVVRTTVAFVDGSEELFSDFPIPDPSTQQKIAAVVTFGTRYNLFALLAVCPENDDDGNSGSNCTAPGASSHGLPGLPGSSVQPMQVPQHVWPQPGLPVQPMPVPQLGAPVIGYPVQPQPVLPQ
jgi:hypothetical protein